MILNGKQLIDWSEEDLMLLVGNDDYKENESIDYKVNFSFLEYVDKNDVRSKKEEFRNDVCAFANANGGYLMFELAESFGVPSRILGVDIKDGNTDAFELNLRNIISFISPVAPACTIKFILLSSGKYVVTIQVHRGSYIPYVNKENDYFKFYIRRGNGKVTMNYEEVKAMFNNSLMLSEQIDEFRRKRIRMCKEKEGVASPMEGEDFSLIHFIPDFAFSNHQYFDPINSLAQREIQFDRIFQHNCYGTPVPNVDGLAYCDRQYSRDYYLQIFKSGITEKFCAIKKHTHQDSKLVTIPMKSLCDNISTLFKESIELYKRLNAIGTIFVCISIINCKGCCTENNFYNDYRGFVDRNEVLCMPVAIIDIHNDEKVKQSLESLLTDLCRSVGIWKYKDYINV